MKISMFLNWQLSLVHSMIDQFDNMILQILHSDVKKTYFFLSSLCVFWKLYHRNITV